MVPGLAVALLAVVGNIAGDCVRNLDRSGVSMLNFAGKRLASMIVILVVLAATVFVLQHISPLDPVHAKLGGQASQSAVAQQRHELGLDKPITAQFGALPRGGRARRPRRVLPHPSAGDHRPGAYVPATAELAAAALVIALVLGVLFAFLSTLRVPGAGAFRFVLVAGASRADVPARHRGHPDLLPAARLAAGQRSNLDHRRSHGPDPAAHGRRSARTVGPTSPGTRSCT